MPGRICRRNRREVIRIRDVKKWIVGFPIAALLAVGVVVLAGNGLGGATPVSAESCPAVDDALCDRDDDGDGIPNSEDSDWVCPSDERGCGESAGTCQGLAAATRSLAKGRLAGSCGSRLGRRDGQGFGGCRGGRF